jgi:hypothetical protein
MEIKEYYCQGTMLSHEADYWRCKLIDRHLKDPLIYYFDMRGITLLCVANALA